MSELSTAVSVAISRQTRAASQAAFGIPAIIAEFAASVTTVPFTRMRSYTSTTEMTTDAVPQNIIDAASILFQQDPNPGIVKVGRLDALDAGIEEGLAAIQIEDTDWYVFSVLGFRTGVVTLSTALIGSNVIHSTVNGIAVADVTFSGDHATTMGLWETAIETALGTKFAATDNANTMTIEGTGVDVNSIVCTVSGGSTQPTVAISYELVDASVLEVAAWTETQMKLYFVCDSDTTLPSSATSDLAYQLKALNRNRTIVLFHGDADDYADMAWIGAVLWYEPGAAAWGYKTLNGVTADSMTSSQEGYIWGKNANNYTVTAGISNTRKGLVASGERIDVMIGVDWITARLQERLFTMLSNTPKVPMDDAGLLAVYQVVSSTLTEAEARGILISGQTKITMPKYKDLTSEQKIAGQLPISFTAKLVMSVLFITITGVVTA